MAGQERETEKNMANQVTEEMREEMQGTASRLRDVARTQVGEVAGDLQIIDKPTCSVSKYIDIINANRLRSGMPTPQTPEDLMVHCESTSSSTESSATPSWMTLHQEENAEAIGQALQEASQGDQQDSKDSEEKEKNIVEEEVCSMDASTQDRVASNQDQPSAQKKAKKGDKSKNGKEDNKGGRQLVNGSHVCKLVADYWKHFNEFSKGRKKALIQLIPSKLWTKVYKDYLVEFPESRFKEESLKFHLRLSLTEMTSGVNNPEGGNTATVQDEELMRKLKETPSMKARNILKVREAAVNGEIPTMDFGDPSLSSSSPVVRADTSGPKECIVLPASPCASGSVVHKAPVLHKDKPCASGPVVQKTPILDKDKPVTKSQNLKRAREDISSMLTEFSKITQTSQEDSAMKKQCTEAKMAMMVSKKREAEQRERESAAREKESAARWNAQLHQNKLAQVTILEKQKYHGLIGDEEFIQKLKLLLDS